LNTEKKKSISNNNHQCNGKKPVGENERAQFPEARFILSILAQEHGEEGRVFSLWDIKEAYIHLGVQFEQERVLHYLHHLVEEEFVEERENDTQFRIPVGLIRGWLQKAWPPEKVVRVQKLAKVRQGNEAVHSHA